MPTKSQNLRKYEQPLDVADDTQHSLKNFIARKFVLSKSVFEIMHIEIWLFLSSKSSV